MKTLKNISTLTIITALVVFSFKGTANTTPAGTVTPSPEKTISNYFKFPQVLIPYNNTNVTHPVKVEVIFTTDKTGKVNYAYAKTRDQKLKKEIEKQFSSFKISQVQHDVVHSVVLNFKYINGDI